ncbi:MAG: Rieske 2Fe-2S domain-containing protein, partial [Thermoplasmata archaeon]
MLKNKWYIVLDSNELKTDRSASIRLFGNEIILWRDSRNNVHAIEARCPHRGANLGLGRIIGDCLQCPYHGFLFDGDGKAVLIPSMGESAMISKNYKAKNYSVKEYMNFIFLWYGDAHPTEEIRWLDGIDDSFTFSTMKAVWNTNYTR